MAKDGLPRAAPRLSRTPSIEDQSLETRYPQSSNEGEVVQVLNEYGLSKEEIEKLTKVIKSGLIKYSIKPNLWL